MRNIIRYVLVCVATLLLAVLTANSFCLFLLAMELLLPAALYIQVRFLTGRMHVELQAAGMIAKGQEATAVVRICNHAWLPVSFAALDVVVKDVFDASVETQETVFMVDAKGCTEVPVRLHTDYAWKLLLYPGQLRVWDNLKLFSAKVSLDGASAQVIVRPDVYGVGTSENRVYGGRKANGSQTLSDVVGDDISEVLDTRSYQEGDTLHTVHWKLSAKMDDLLVKVYSASADKEVYLYIDLYRKAKGSWSHELFDGMMTIMTSVSYFLQGRQIRHSILWYEAERDRLCRAEVMSPYDALELVGTLAGTPTYQERDTHERAQLAVGAYAEASSCLRLDTQLHLFWQDNCLAAFEHGALEQELNRLRI